MDIETMKLARAELEKLIKTAYRGPHPQRHLFLYFDWLENNLADQVFAGICGAVEIDNLRSLVLDQLKGNE